MHQVSNAFFIDPIYKHLQMRTLVFILRCVTACKFTRQFYQDPGKRKKGEADMVIGDQQHRLEQRKALLNEII
jgi:hypothetical protein